MHGNGGGASSQSNRADGRRRYALGTLEQACDRVRTTGPGLRNTTLNSEALQVAHFIGSKDLTEDEARKRLLEAARQARIPEREALATLRSAFKRGELEPAFGGQAQADLRDTRLSNRVHDRVIRWLVERCPLDSRPDVMSYLVGRGIIHGAIAFGCFSLPRAAEQAPLIDAWRKVCGDERVLGTGLIPTKDGEPIWSRFTYGDWHPLAIPWRDPTGHVALVQRRMIAKPRADDRKYLFPVGRKVEWPLGIDRLMLAPEGAGVVIVEGPTDTFAMAQRLDGYFRRRGGAQRFVLGKSQGQGWRTEWCGPLEGRNVIVATDNDAAGDKGAETIMAALAGVAKEVRRVRPANKDWAER